MKINNINKRLLSTSLAVTMTLTTLTGCYSYKEDENGDVYLDGEMSYETLSEYKLIELKTLNGSRLYIADYDDAFGDCKYKDVFTGLTIYDAKDKDTSIELVSEYKLGDYLVALGDLKKNYTSDDIYGVLNDINEVYDFGDNVQLEK